MDMFEPARSDDDTAGHIVRAGKGSDSDEAAVVVAARTPTHHSTLTGFGRLVCFGLFEFNVALKHLRSYRDGACL